MASGLSTIKKKAQTNATKDFVLYLVGAGRMAAEDIPPAPVYPGTLATEDIPPAPVYPGTLAAEDIPASPVCIDNDNNNDNDLFYYSDLCYNDFVTSSIN